MGEHEVDVALAQGGVGRERGFGLALVEPQPVHAGVDLHRKLGEQVKQGEPLYTIHAEFAADFRFACEATAKESGYLIVAAEPARE